VRLTMCKNYQSLFPYVFAKTICYSSNDHLIKVINSISIDTVHIKQNVYGLVQKETTQTATKAQRTNQLKERVRNFFT
jgi:hypothetical protein